MVAARKKITSSAGRNKQLPALEKNVLLYRTLQVALLLHKVQAFREFIAESVKATNKLRALSNKPLIAQRGVNDVDKAMNYLFEMEIISREEKKQIEDIFEFRNDAAHRFELVMSDVSKPGLDMWKKEFDYGATLRLDVLRAAISRKMSPHCIQVMHLDLANFRRIEKAYMEELSRLYNRINTLSKKRSRQQSKSLIEGGQSAAKG